MHGADGAHDGTTRSPRPARRWAFAPLLLAVSAAAVGLAEDAPQAIAPPAFQAGDISIGEPIALPFEPPTASLSPPAAPAAKPAEPQPAALPAVPGNGWLGLVVAESATPGRFAVAEVAAGGPAATSGILAGDEVRAIDGSPLRNSDEVAQALTAIAPGQRVRLAIGRGGQVADVTIEAIPRPQASRGWGAANPAPDPTPPPPIQAPARAAPIRTDPLPPPTAAVADDPAPPAAGSPPPPFTPAPFPRTVQPAVSDPVQPSPGRVSPPASAAADDSRGRTALGVRTLPIDPNVQARFRLPEASGAYVIGVVGDLPASKAGVPPGSVIVSLDNRPVRSPAELTRLVTTGPVGRPVSLEYVLPGGTARRAEVVLQTLERPLEQALVGGIEPAVTEPPVLQPQPAGTMTRRPVSPLDGPTAALVRDEIRQLRLRLESLERRLEAAGR